MYNSGDRVALDGSVWEANWWTQGDEPGSSDWGPWQEVEADDPDPEPPDGPTAAFDVSDDSPAPGEDVEFDASTAEGEIDSYEWDLGDGTELEGEIVTHSYDDDGEYEVELRSPTRPERLRSGDRREWSLEQARDSLVVYDRRTENV
ncbi:PKD domain-containing protein [Natrarchaeobius chitinivorans]|uniref:PKD domain-containing protein n=1 Tax=Natrarchaeobius chitinivorans TaxID=1679083 RepID=UPI001A9E9C5F|nr:PKD domain-containing protein [Natrarchaeobius chitinivorans]